MCKKSDNEVCAHLECAGDQNETTGNESASVTGYAPIVSKVQLRGVVLDWHKNACKIPPDWDPIIAEIVDAHLKSLSISLGNLELCVRRTLSHTEEVKEGMPK